MATLSPSPICEGDPPEDEKASVFVTVNTSWRRLFRVRGNVRSWELTALLQGRWAPLVYVFAVDQLKKRPEQRDPRFQHLLERFREARRREGLPEHGRAYIVTAYLVERAFGDACWKAWAIKRPYHDTDPEIFYRRYIRGDPTAVPAFRATLRLPHDSSCGPDRPCPLVTHDLDWFLGQPGAAAERFHLDRPRPLRVQTLIPLSQAGRPQQQRVRRIPGHP